MSYESAMNELIIDLQADLAAKDAALKKACALLTNANIYLETCKAGQITRAKIRAFLALHDPKGESK